MRQLKNGTKNIVYKKLYTSANTSKCRNNIMYCGFKFDSRSGRTVCIGVPFAFLPLGSQTFRKSYVLLATADH